MENQDASENISCSSLSPLSRRNVKEEEKKALLSLIEEHPVIQSKHGSHRTVLAKSDAWKKIAKQFYQKFPPEKGELARSPLSLKRWWFYQRDKKKKQTKSTEVESSPTGENTDTDMFDCGVVGKESILKNLLGTKVTKKKILQIKKSEEGIVLKEVGSGDCPEDSDPLWVNDEKQETSGDYQKWSEETALLSAKDAQNSHPSQRKHKNIDRRGSKSDSEQVSCDSCDHAAPTHSPHHHSESQNQKDSVIDINQQGQEQKGRSSPSLKETEEDPLNLEFFDDFARGESLMNTNITAKLRDPPFTNGVATRNHSRMAESGEAEDSACSSSKDSPRQRVKETQKEVNAEKRAKNAMHEAYGVAMEYISARESKRSEYDRVMHERQLQCLDEFHKEQISLLKTQAELIGLQKKFWEEKLAGITQNK